MPATLQVKRRMGKTGFQTLGCSCTNRPLWAVRRQAPHGAVGAKSPDPHLGCTQLTGFPMNPPARCASQRRCDGLKKRTNGQVTGLLGSMLNAVVPGRRNPIRSKGKQRVGALLIFCKTVYRNYNSCNAPGGPGRYSVTGAKSRLSPAMLPTPQDLPYERGSRRRGNVPFLRPLCFLLDFWIVR